MPLPSFPRVMGLLALASLSACQNPPPRPTIASPDDPAEQHVIARFLRTPERENPGRLAAMLKEEFSTQEELARYFTSLGGTCDQSRAMTCTYTQRMPFRVYAQPGSVPQGSSVRALARREITVLSRGTVEGRSSPIADITAKIQVTAQVTGVAGN